VKEGGEVKEGIDQEWKGEMRRCTKKRGEKKEEGDSTGGKCRNFSSILTLRASPSKCAYCL
jgi:hypothetical protein